MHVTRYLIPLGLAAFLQAQAQLAPVSIPVDGYAAVVNSRVITVSDVMSLIRPYERQLRSQYRGDEYQEKLLEVFRDARETLIEQALILTDFEQQGAQLPDQLVDQRIDEIINERFEGNRTKFLKALEEERTPLADWRNQVKEEMIVAILRRQEVNARIKISPSQVRRRYDELREDYFTPAKVRLSIITLQLPAAEEEAEAQRKLAQSLFDRLENGADFPELAREFSQGSKAAAGGDWGWLEQDALNPLLAEAVTGLVTGQVSNPIESDKEIFLVRLDDRQEEAYVPFERVREEMETTLRKEEGERIYKNWVNRLRNKYTVKIY